MVLIVPEPRGTGVQFAKTQILPPLELNLWIPGNGEVLKHLRKVVHRKRKFSPPLGSLFVACKVLFCFAMSLYQFFPPDPADLFVYKQILVNSRRDLVFFVLLMLSISPF